MSKKREDYTLSDLLQLKMSWFFDKNPNKQDLIDYIRSMVVNNTFKGNIKLSQLFPDYVLPQTIPEINKIYFENYDKLPTIDIPEVDPTAIDKICTHDKEEYKQAITNTKNDIENYLASIQQLETEISNKYRGIHDYLGNIQEHKIKIEAYELMLSKPDEVDTAYRDNLLLYKNTEFKLCNINTNSNEITFVSKRPIVCGYYSGATRIEKEFGYAFITFGKLRNGLELKTIQFSHKFMNGNSNRHPHVNSSGTLCSGDVSHITRNIEVSLDKRLNAMYSLLTTYNPSNPYLELSKFTGELVPNTNLSLELKKLVLSPEEVLESIMGHMMKDFREGYADSFIDQNTSMLPSRLVELRENVDSRTNTNIPYKFDFSYGTLKSRYDFIEEATEKGYQEFKDAMDSLCFLNYGKYSENSRYIAFHSVVLEFRDKARNLGVTGWGYSSRKGQAYKGKFMGYDCDTAYSMSNRSDREFFMPLFMCCDAEIYEQIMTETYNWARKHYVLIEKLQDDTQDQQLDSNDIPF